MRTQIQAGLKLKPEMIGSHVFLGSSLLYVEKPADAIAHLRYAHDRQPTVESARYLGLAYTALDLIGGFHVFYGDLFDPREAAGIYEYLTRQRFDAARHEQLIAMHVEPNFPKVKIKPDRARAFRDRIQRAFV